jgi:hypothetical protein
MWITQAPVTASRQERSVEVDPAEPRDREQLRRENLAVIADDEEVRGEAADHLHRLCCVHVRRIDHGNARSLRGFSDRVRRGPAARSRAGRPRDDRDDTVP